MCIHICGSTGIKLSCAALVLGGLKSDEASLPFKKERRWKRRRKRGIKPR